MSKPRLGSYWRNIFVEERYKMEDTFRCVDLFLFWNSAERKGFIFIFIVFFWGWMGLGNLVSVLCVVHSAFYLDLHTMKAAIHQQ